MKKMKPDILINNAGYIHPNPIINHSDEDFLKHIQVNLLGTYYCTKYALQNNCSLIINIGSSAGNKGKENWSAYCSSKSALIMFTSCLYKEGYNTVCVSPGRTNTKMRNMLFNNEDKDTLLIVDDISNLINKIINDQPKYCGKHINIRKVKEGVEECIENL